MRAYVGVTDHEWYRFLAARPGLDEVNFWRPGGGQQFRVLTPGEPFFFKTHAPHNRVVGGGFFSGFAALRLSEAWELFGESNGVPGLPVMRQRVGRYRREPLRPGQDPVIGCVFIRDTRFFAPGDEAGAPPQFAISVVQGKSHDLADSAHAGYFADLLDRLLGGHVDLDLNLGQPWHRDGPRVRRPSAGAATPRAALVPGRRPRRLPAALRHHRRPHPACAAGRAHPAATPRPRGDQVRQP